MATIFKRTRRKPIPAGAEIIVKGGKRYATWTDKRTKRPRRELLADDSQAILVEDDNYTIEYVDENGKPQRLSSGTPDKDAAKQLASKLQTTAMKRKCGLINPVHARIAVEAKKPIQEHLDDFRNSLSAKNRTGRYVFESCELIRRIVEACNARYLEDLTTVAVEAAISDIRDSGRGLATCNRMITAIKSFSRWLWRDKRTADDKLTFLTRFNEAEDPRHVRRELTPDEITWLLTTAEGRTLPGHRISGPERAMCYRLALSTGFRAGELRSLTTRSFDLDSNSPGVTVQAAHSKRRRIDRQPIRGDLVELLRPWLAQFKEGEKVFPHLPQQTAKMFRKDLAAARNAWIAEMKTDAEKEECEKSDFLKYKNTAGEFADFHATRHTYISSITNGGAPIKVAQELARHSTPALTFGRYSHVRSHSVNAALDYLPNITSTIAKSNPESNPLEAAGTDDAHPQNTRCGQWGSEWGSAQTASPGVPLANLGETIAECTEESKQPNSLPINTLSDVRRDLAKDGQPRKFRVHPLHHPSCGRASTEERG